MKTRTQELEKNEYFILKIARKLWEEKYVVGKKQLVIPTQWRIEWYLKSS